MPVSERFTGMRLELSCISLRDSIESEVYPTAKIIGDLSSNSTDTEIFVDNSQFFNYEENESATIINGVDALIVTGQDPVSAAITATVSAAGTISALTINSSGSGYVGSTVTVKISAPLTVGISTIFIWALALNRIV